jgi:SOS-response transcriptional repressor LexA
MKTLTKQQRKVLTYIREYIEDNRYPPSRREIAENCIGSYSPNAATKHILALKFKGYISSTAGVNRSIVVLAPDVGFGSLDVGVANAFRRSNLHCAEDVIQYIDSGGDIENIQSVGKSRAELFFKWVDSNEKKAGINYG